VQVDHSKIIQDWLETKLGAALLQQECRIVEEILDGAFGEQFLQLGLWGDKRTFARFTRTQHCSIISKPITIQPYSSKPCVIGHLHQLPIESDSIDVILLPHSLDYSDRPHAILREVDRVLRRDGRVIILGFKLGGLWGLRRLIPGAGIPPGANYLISERRMKDWLQLLDMRIDRSLRYFFRLPLLINKTYGKNKWELRGQTWWPELSACYMLSAQKRVSTLTHVRSLWRRKPQVVAGLAGSQTRVSRIHFQESKIDPVN